ncbi:MAG: hypothetical protein EB015_16210, partial [Methylocystaceae bacterium]|nr:hypothetical protein [Methylocystaceae bacterium]
LENRRRCKPTVGSNPTSSAKNNRLQENKSFPVTGKKSTKREAEYMQCMQNYIHSDHGSF